MLDLSRVAIATVHSLLIVTDIVGNSLVCAIIKKNKDMRYALNRIAAIFSEATGFYLFFRKKMVTKYITKW